MNSVNNADLSAVVPAPMSAAAARTAALDAVRKAAARIGPAEVKERDAVHAAYAAGASIREIAEAIDSNQPAVSHKFGPFRQLGDPATVARDVIALHRAAAGGLEKARDAHAAIPAARAALDEAVKSARAIGVVWASIAETLGKNRANVVEEYKHVVEGATERPARKPRVNLTREQRVDLTRRVRNGEDIADLAAESGASARYVRWLRLYGPVE